MTPPNENPNPHGDVVDHIPSDAGSFLDGPGITVEGDGKIELDDGRVIDLNDGAEPFQKPGGGVDE